MRTLFLTLFMLTMSTLYAQEPAPNDYPPGTALVLAPATYPLAAIEISAGIKGAVVVETPLLQAFGVAKADPNVVGIVDIRLATDVWDETGRVACYSPDGKKQWEERVRFGLGGSAEHVAAKFTTRLAKKVRGKSCP